MSDTLLSILLALAVLLFLGWLAMGGRTVFVVEFVDGVAYTRRGRPPGGFVSACTDVARLYGIRRGRIRAVRGRGTVRLTFSKEIPERARQPLRNVWTPPPTGGPGGGRASA